MRPIRVTPPPAPPRFKKLPDAVRRQRALDRTQGKFAGKPFAWGRADCLVLARYHLSGMGHRVPKVPSYRNLAGALRALKGQGVETLEQLLDRYLERIAPAAMLKGDIALVVDEEDAEMRAFGGMLSISLGYKYWGWHPDAPTLAVIDVVPSAVRAAWRA